MPLRRTSAHPHQLQGCVRVPAGRRLRPQARETLRLRHLSDRYPSGGVHPELWFRVLAEVLAGQPGAGVSVRSLRLPHRGIRRGLFSHAPPVHHLPRHPRLRGAAGRHILHLLPAQGAGGLHGGSIRDIVPVDPVASGSNGHLGLDVRADAK